LEASIKMAGKLAPDRQSGHGANTGAGVCYQVARIGSLPSGLPGAGAVGWWAVSMRSLVLQAVIADADVMKPG
jgi:hypothetical protein